MRLAKDSFSCWRHREGHEPYFDALIFARLGYCENTDPQEILDWAALQMGCGMKCAEESEEHRELYCDRYFKELKRRAAFEPIHSPRERSPLLITGHSSIECEVIVMRRAGIAVKEDMERPGITVQRDHHGDILGVWLNCTTPEGAEKKLVKAAREFDCPDLKAASECVLKDSFIFLMRGPEASRKNTRMIIVPPLCKLVWPDIPRPVLGLN